tara:strand:+ start:982 stop:2232 length:1251 start_codon:yes stop_codon:yes gene_type:complete
MVKKIQSIRGMVDLFHQEMRDHLWVIQQARTIAKLYGFDEVSTPILEKTEVFSRPLGQTSDVVSKETYTFNDRGDDSLTLRPEGTAGIMRSVISNGKFNELPLKLFYSGPMFRYERPQKGRLRQFNQIGIELIGISEPFSDAEVIMCGVNYLKSLNVLDKCLLNINTLGDKESRDKYRSSLIEYFTINNSKLSNISQERLKINPLRILDSKEAQDQEIISKAPSFSNHLNSDSKKHFDKVLNYLEVHNVKYVYNEKLVRGLDYYCHTTFEFITDQLGSQGTVLGGGRYDGLSETLNGPYLPGVGFAAGVERLVLLSENNNKIVSSIGVIPIEEKNLNASFEIIENLRSKNISSELFNYGNISKQIKKSISRNIRHIIIIGDQELKTKQVILRDLSEGTQKLIFIENLVDEIMTLDK